MKIERTLAATFPNESQAIAAIDRLVEFGIPENNVGILMSSGTSEKEFSLEPRTKSFEGVAAGSTIGGAIGSVLGGLTAIGSIPLSGGASLIAAGPFFAALAGLGLGSTIGGLSGGLIGLGFEEYGGGLVERGLGEGRVLVAVTTTEDIVDNIKILLNESGGRDISVARKIRRDRPGEGSGVFASPPP